MKETATHSTFLLCYEAALNMAFKLIFLEQEEIFSSAKHVPFSKASRCFGLICNFLISVFPSYYVTTFPEKVEIYLPSRAYA